jgi:rhamnulokinase
VSVLAFDLGASSGRALIGELKDGRMTVTEIHRFPNDPVQTGGRLYWDILRLLHEVKQGILKARLAGYGDLQGIAIDSWAVDFGLIGANGELLANPYHYRDHHTDHIMDEVHAMVGGRAELFSRTGIQFLTFNSINQLFAMRKAGSPLLDQAQALLMIPDLLGYFLTGVRQSEFTNATTTQLFNPINQNWDDTLIAKLGLPRRLFTDVVQPGTIVGPLLPDVCEELGVGPIPFIATTEHDTGAAVAAVPADSGDFAYLSCGTWSLLGTEVAQPVLNERALALNFTNEGGYGNTYRLLKNIMGLWLIQECLRMWKKEGNELSYEQMVAQAEQAAPFRSLIDPDDAVFLNPANMPQQIREYCRKAGQPVPESAGEIVRCVLESLALKYRYVLECTEQLAGKRFAKLNMVGGGINNKLLCQFTANAIGRPVEAGPTEGSGIGNLLVQWLALGEIADIKQARAIVRDSFPLDTYTPHAQAEWDRVYTAWREKLGL